MQLTSAQVRQRRLEAKARARRNAKRDADEWHFSQTLLRRAVDRSGNVDEVDLEMLTATGRRQGV